MCVADRFVFYMLSVMPIDSIVSRDVTFAAELRLAINY